MRPSTSIRISTVREESSIKRQDRPPVLSAALSSGSVHHSVHSGQRADQRGINDEVIKNVLRFGTLIKKQGLHFYVGTVKTLPGWLGHKLIEKCNDVVVIVRQGEIITCYKSSSGMKHIKKKPDRLAGGR
jgi:hypothetical protein